MLKHIKNLPFLKYNMKEKSKKVKKFSVYFYSGKLYPDSNSINLNVSIIVSIPEDSKMDTMILVTTLNVNKNNVINILDLYLKRWRIETVFEYLKTKFSLESIMVRKFEGMKMMIGFTFFSYAFYYLSYTTKTNELYILKMIKEITCINSKITFGKYVEFILEIFLEYRKTAFINILET